MPYEKPDGPRQPAKNRNVVGSLLLWLSLLFLFNALLFRQPLHPQVSYSTFVDQVEAEQVAQAEIGTDRIHYTLKPQATELQSKEDSQQVYVTVPVAMDLDLPKILRQHRVEFAALPPSAGGWLATAFGWVIPPLISLGYGCC